MVQVTLDLMLSSANTSNTLHRAFEPDMLNKANSVALATSVAHVTTIPFVLTPRRISVNVDSIYPSIIVLPMSSGGKYLVNTVLLIVSRFLTSLISEQWLELYVILAGVSAGGIISHSKNKYSLFEKMEQLYVTVSPGQLMSSLEAMTSDFTRLTDAAMCMKKDISSRSSIVI